LKAPAGKRLEDRSRKGRLATLSSLLRAKGSGAPSLLLFAPFALTLVALLALAASASAATARPFESQITEADGITFAEPTGLAVDNSDDIWVTDAGPSSIDKFDSLGASA